MPHQFSLSFAALDIVLEQLRLGRAPVPFEVPYIGTTHQQRAQVREAVFRDLEAKGLARGGRIDPDAEAAIRILTTAPVAVTAVAQLEDGKQLFARAASDGRFAVVARQDQNLMIFQQLRPTSIVAGVVDLLPATPPAAGQSVTVAKPAPKPSGRHRVEDGGYDPFAAVSKPRSTAPAQLRMVERIFQKPKLRIGQFSAIVPGRDNKARRLTPTAWFDTDEGRYFVTSREAEDGQSWITYAPADNARIAHHLHEQLRAFF